MAMMGGPASLLKTASLDLSYKSEAHPFRRPFYRPRYGSHPIPSLSRSRCGPYPGSPRLTGAAPAARASEQLAKARPPDDRAGAA